MLNMSQKMLIGLYVLILIVGVIMIGIGTEAQHLLNRLEADYGTPFNQYDDLSSQSNRFYHDEIHEYYYGYRISYENYIDRQADPFRELRGEMLYNFSLLGLPFWVLSYIIGSVLIWKLAHQHGKLKQTRRYLRVLFWSGLLVAFSLALLIPAISTIAYITD